MKTIVNLLIVALFIYGANHSIKELLFTVEKHTVKKIKKGLSSSERLAQQLTGSKLNF